MERLRAQLVQSAAADGSSSSSSSSSVRPAATNRKIRESLSHAESALQAYAKEWESKRQSMKMVKRKLLNRHVSTFGAEDMSGEDLAASPYLVFLSSDPQLNLAVRVYLPRGNKLKIGRAVSQAFSSAIADEEREGGAAAAGGGQAGGVETDGKKMLDLQIDGLGIEDLHCILTHDEIDGYSVVSLTPEPDAVTYLNGKQLQAGSEDDADGFVLRRGGGGPAGGDGTYSTVVRRASRSHGGAELGELPEVSPALGKMRSASIIRGVTQLKGGDILVLGECSHVFVFVTPDMVAGVDSGRVTMPTYNQAIREVILGRVESSDERKRRIATRVRIPYTAD